MERYKIRGKKHSPDLVVWLLKTDDFIENTDKIRKYYFHYQQVITDQEQEYYNKNGILSPAWEKAYKYYLNEYETMDKKEFLNNRKQLLENFLVNENSDFFLA